MLKKMTQVASMLLCLLICFCLLPSCQSSDPLAQSGFASLTLDNKERVNAVVTLDQKALSAHTGETVSLYELLPGETVSALTGRAPLDTAKTAAEMRFRFSLTDGERSRLYSSFVIGFEDGSFLSNIGYTIQNPEQLASDTAPFPWAGTNKGLVIDNVDDAMSLGAMHAMFETSISLLMDGTESLSFGGKAYTLNLAEADKLSAKIIAAANAGMQVSLSVDVSAQPSLDTAAMLFDLLVSRTTVDGKASLTAIFIHANAANAQPEAGNGYTAEYASALASIASRSLRSVYTNGRVYIQSHAQTLIDAKTFFSDVQIHVNARGAFPWGASVSPIATAPNVWDTADEQALTLQNLSSLSDFLTSNNNLGAASWFAVNALKYSAADENEQAVSFIYAYQKAFEARAGLIYYGCHFNDACGLRTSAGEERVLTDLFAAIDCKLNADQLALCKSFVPQADWTATVAPSRTDVTGIGNVGTIGLDEDMLFDFTTEKTYGFTGVNSLTAPTTYPSAAWNAPVLYTWLTGNTAEAESGIRTVLSTPDVLRDASSLSAHLLTQIPGAQTCTLRLRLDGYSADGKHLSYESEVTVQNGSWQAVTFQIGAFTTEADLSRPCVITLVTDLGEPTDSDFVFWVKGINIRRPDTLFTKLLPYLLIAFCIAAVFVSVFIIHKLTTRRRNTCV